MRQILMVKINKEAEIFHRLILYTVNIIYCLFTEYFHEMADLLKVIFIKIIKSLEDDIIVVLI